MQIDVISLELWIIKFFLKNEKEFCYNFFFMIIE